jgi:hypothetical protein
MPGGPGTSAATPMPGAWLAAAACWGPLPVTDGVERCLRLLDEAGGNRFLGAVQASRDVLASRVEAVLAEARQEAGDDPVDPRLLLALTEALAAIFDPGYH